MKIPVTLPSSEEYYPMVQQHALGQCGMQDLFTESFYNLGEAFALAVGPRGIHGWCEAEDDAGRHSILPALDCGEPILRTLQTGVRRTFCRATRTT